VLNELIGSMEHFWRLMLLHLWQTSLVLLGLWLLSLPLRRAPAKFVHVLWSAGLIKLLLPLPVFSRLLPVLVPNGLGSSQSSPLVSGYTVVVDVLCTPPDLIRHVSQSPFFIGCVTAIWAGIGGFLLVRTLRKAFRRYESCGMPLSGLIEEDFRVLQRIVRSVGIDPSMVIISDRDVIPSIVGIVNRRFVLPMGLIRRMSEREIEAILMHENAHCMRYDTLWHFLQSIIRSIFFFYPAIFPLIRKLRSTAEMACDEHVLSHGVDARTYLAALLRSLQFGLVPVGLSSAVIGVRSSFHSRIVKIETYRRRTAMQRYYIILGAALSLVLLGSFIPPTTYAGTDESSGADTEFVEYTEPPKPINTVPPEYPERAKRDGVSGTVYVKIHIDAQGAVTETRIQEGVDGYPEFGQAAEAALIQWKFQPAELDGEPVAVWVVIPVKFALDKNTEK